MSGRFDRLRIVLGAREVLDNRDLWRMLLAEFVGTLFLVLVACGGCIRSEGDIVHIALAFGVTVATIAQCIGHVSGGHLNPAVTFGMLVAGKVSLVRALFHIISQCVGGIVGAALLKALTPEPKLQANLCMTTIAPHVNVAQAFGVEFLITFVLVLTVFGVCDEFRSDVKGSAPLAIGLSISTCHLFAVPYTGSSMNPARTFGPAVMTGIWDDHWIYWFGPCLGGISAAVVYQLAFRAPKPRPKEEPEMPSLLHHRRAPSPPKEEVINRTTAI